MINIINNGFIFGDFVSWEEILEIGKLLFVENMSLIEDEENSKQEQIADMMKPTVLDQEEEVLPRKSRLDIFLQKQFQADNIFNCDLGTGKSSNTGFKRKRPTEQDDLILF